MDIFKNIENVNSLIKDLLKLKAKGENNLVITTVLINIIVVIIAVYYNDMKLINDINEKNIELSNSNMLYTLRMLTGLTVSILSVIATSVSMFLLNKILYMNRTQ